jgi:uncharacterized protein (DUF885 family)
MIGMSAARELADRLDAALNRANPFEASNMGVSGYDDLVPDASEAGEARRRADMEEFLAEAATLEVGAPSPADSVTLGCVTTFIDQEIAVIDSAGAEHTVSSQPFAPPAQFFAVAARTVPADSDAAVAYLTRLSRSGDYIDQLCERLRAGAAKGRLPVAPLAADAIEWAERLMAAPVPAPLAAPQPPAGWAGANDWVEQRDRIATKIVRPAIGRWTETIRDLLPRSRPADRAGLMHIPGGDEDYQRLIRLHTTLPLTAEEIHQTGLDQVAALEARALDLGASIGLPDRNAIHAAQRASAGRRPPEESIRIAIDAVRRAEAHAGEMFPPPLPPPCDIQPMPDVVAVSGTAPHYTPPRADGTRPGTYWFNTRRPTAGTGFDLEVVAFHEAVPGHHLQFGRIMQLTGLSELQRTRYLTVFSEGWGLYAEQLAEEMGIYSDTEALLGMITASLMRAARLVVDTGMHALGWSRHKALHYFVEHVPVPPEFAANEIDRYVTMPGQALSYMTGKLEIVKARDRAQERLGSAFALPGFHAALLDSGSLPMPVLHRHIDRWIESSAAGAS